MNNLSMQVKGANFNLTDIQFLTENSEFTNEVEMDENDVEIVGKKNGIKVPVKYNFPVLDEKTGDYIIEEIDGAMEMTLGGYGLCRQNGGAKEQCLQELKDDVEYNIQVFKKNVEKEFEELTQKQFQEELESLDTL